jgi:hypothetical protein
MLRASSSWPSFLERCINTCLFPSHEVSIPEICQKCDHFAAFAGVSAKYLGEREEEFMKKRGRQTGKERFTIHASLCGRGDLLKAQGLVAHYLADGIFYDSYTLPVKLAWS